MATNSAHEQLILELINRARLDPAAEAARLGIGLNEGLSAGTISKAAKQPLAANPLLVDAARDHSQWMLNRDKFQHEGAGGSSPTERIVDAELFAVGDLGRQARTLRMLERVARSTLIREVSFCMTIYSRVRGIGPISSMMVFAKSALERRLAISTASTLSC